MKRPTALLFLMTMSASALAGTQLNAEQIKKLVTGNTVLAGRKDMSFKNYYAPDGSMISRNESTGEIYKDKRWRVSDAGDICSQVADKKETCGQLFDNGDGTYNRLDNGNPRGVWNKIVPGNALAK